MKDFTDELKHDHQVIRKVVAGMSAVAELLDAGKQVDPSILGDLVQFLRTFAGACHHAKEENYLFPLLKTKGSVGTDRQLRQLEHEHRTATDLVDQLEKISTAYVINPLVVRYRLVGIIRELADIYPKHIWKEDYLLSPMAQQTLSSAEQDHLRDKFDEVELEVGTDVHHAFEMLAEKLEAVVQYRNSGACSLCSSAA
jgi:hemerythrin-like domain-containing protein